MIECKLDRGEGTANISGSLFEQSADIAVIIHVVFNSYVAKYPALRKFAKELLQDVVNDETNVIFKLDSELDAEIRANEGNHMPGTSME